MPYVMVLLCLLHLKTVFSEEVPITCTKNSDCNFGVCTIERVCSCDVGFQGEWCDIKGTIIQPQ